MRSTGCPQMPHMGLPCRANAARCRSRVEVRRFVVIASPAGWAFALLGDGCALWGDVVVSERGGQHHGGMSVAGRVAACVVVVAVLSGCGLSSAAQTSSTPTRLNDADMAQLVVPADPVPLGTAVTLDFTRWNAGAYTMNVHEVRVIPRADQYSVLQPGQQVVGVDVEYCGTTPGASAGAGSVQSDNRWALVDARGGRYEPEMFMPSDAALTPEYPYNRAVVADGECLRGWVPFVTQAGVDLDAVRYAVSGSAATVRWAVS